jgi:uncharacterized protein (TIGR02145 family)
LDINHIIMKIRIIRVYIISILFVVFYSCQKNEKTVLSPTVLTASVDQISNTSARVGGQVSSDGGAEVTDRGIYWGKLPNPDSTGVKLQIGKDSGAFYDTLSGLTPGVKYYVKAYATNSQGTSYGSETFFTTQINLPTIITSQATNVQPTSALIGGNITEDGGYRIIQRGIYWGIATNPQLTGSIVGLDTGKGQFTYTLTGLSRAITYYVVAFATNIKGTSYGSQISFSTQPGLPTVYTSTVLNISASSATVGGNISSEGGASVTERGVYWGTAPGVLANGAKLAIGSGSGSFTNTLSSLNPGVTYYLQAYAINSAGTAYGSEISFVTLGKAPTAGNLQLTNLTASGATLKALVNANNLSTVVTFEYGTSSSYGNTVTASNSPSTGSSDTMKVVLTGLSSNTTYHYRVEAVNALGSVYGNDTTFTTVLTGITGTVNDADGNTYNTIGIGYQVWMTENLKTTKYNDNTSITLVTNDTSWNKLSTAAYCWYNNDETAYKSSYGAIYNWYTVNTSKLCPTGWHVPTDDDFTTLVEYVGGASSAGGILKESGTSHWSSPNTGATNGFGFTSLPGGVRYDSGSFDFLGSQGNWWSATSYSTIYAKNLNLYYNYSNSFQVYTNKKYGMSIRCVKD